MTAESAGIIALGVYLFGGIIGASLLIARMKPLIWPSWLRLTPTKDLLRQAIAAEITVHIMPDLTRKVYSTKLNTLTQPAIAKVVEHLIASGMELGQQHGIQVHLCTEPKHQGVTK